MNAFREMKIENGQIENGFFPFYLLPSTYVYSLFIFFELKMNTIEDKNCEK